MALDGAGIDRSGDVCMSSLRFTLLDAEQDELTRIMALALKIEPAYSVAIKAAPQTSEPAGFYSARPVASSRESGVHF